MRDWDDKGHESEPWPIRLHWQPNLGLVYEDVIESDKVEEGSVTRFNAGINISLNILKDRLENDPEDPKKKKKCRDPYFKYYLSISGRLLEG